MTVGSEEHVAVGSGLTGRVGVGGIAVGSGLDGGVGGLGRFHSRDGGCADIDVIVKNIVRHIEADFRHTHEGSEEQVVGNVADIVGSEEL